MTTQPTYRVREFMAVFLGGLLGTALRLAVDVAFPHEAAEFPWETLLINVLGSLLLGMLVARLWRPATPAWLRAGLSVGVLGAFTTFSAVMVSAVAMTASGQWMLAVWYLLASVALGFGAAAIGLRLGRPRFTGVPT